MPARSRTRPTSDGDASAALRALLAQHAAGGGWGLLARAVTLVENAPPWDVELPAAPAPVHTIGVTGPPGAGKSTLTARLIESYGDAGARIAVLAVDPSSPITGGAVLGDRVRMEPALRGRTGVFVRSLASRGGHGALARATRAAARLLEASGAFDVIVIETVGAGQTEVAVAGLADTVVLVTVPGLGDSVQGIKAGTMELADVLVVNMADRPGARETVRHLRLALGRELAILLTVATEGEGVAELRAELDRRWDQLTGGGELGEQRARKRLAEATLVAEEWLRACAAAGGAADPAGLRLAVGQLLDDAAVRWRRAR